VSPLSYLKGLFLFKVIFKSLIREDRGDQAEKLGGGYLLGIYFR
jgi:hypothetical protein